MKIYRPIKQNYRTQAFGESAACVKLGTDGKPIRPFKVIGKNTTAICPAGYQDFYTAALGMEGHNGEDWNSGYKDPCHFPVEIKGVKWFAKNEVDKDGGIGVDVISDLPISIDVLPPQTGPKAKALWKKQSGKLRVKIRTWHHQSSLVKDGEEVVFGQLIALCDSTGASGGNHLHWSMKFVDAKGNTLDANNGYTGAVDFSHWFENRFVMDEIDERNLIVAAMTLSEVARKRPAERPSLFQRLKEILAFLTK